MSLRPSFLSRRHVLLVGSLLAYACSDGGGGGCDGCGGEGDGPAYVYPSDAPQIQQAAQVHVTERGFDFIGENAGPLVGSLLGDGGLSFCLEEQNIEVIGLSAVRVCNGTTCDDGTAGCQLNFSLENIEIVPNTVPTGSDYLRVSLGLGVDESLPLRLIGANCTASLESPPGGIPIAANIYFDVNMERNERVSIRFPTEELEFALSDDYIDVSGSGLSGIVCGGVNLLAGALLPILEDQIAGPLEDAIGPALCTSCATNTDCPGGSTCSDEVCVYEGTSECVPLALGVETELNLGELLADFAPGLDARLGILFYLANYADAVGPTAAPYVGLDLAAQAGFTSEPSTCVPYEPPPSTARIPKSPSINAETSPSGLSFAVGIGLARSAINLALWGVYNSGALCLKIGTETVEQVSTSTFSALLPSLGTLTDNENRPMYLQLRPQRAPTATLGVGTVEYGSDGVPVIVDPLITLNLNELFIDFYGFVESRYVRLFTLDTDVAVPLGLDVNDASQLIVILGDLSEAITRIEPLNGELLARADIDSVAELLPTLIASLLPALGGDLIPPIDIPSFEGLQLVLSPGAITSVDANEMLAIYADLALAPAEPDALTMLPMPQVVATEVRQASQADIASMIRRVRTSGESLDIAMLTPEVVIALDTLIADLDAPALEYSYRINGGLWSFWYRGDTMRLRDPALLLQGEHVIDVRVREQGAPHSVSPHLAQTVVVIDHEGPRVDAQREGLVALVTARDAVSAERDLTMRWRVNHGEWSAIEAFEPQIDLSAWAGGNALLEVDVFDAAGHRGTTTRSFNLSDEGRLPVETGTPLGGATDAQSGCSAATGTGGPFAFLLALMALVAFRGRRLAVAGVAAALLLGACGNDKRTNDRIDCDPACADGEYCVGGECVECRGGEDCESGVCEAGVCVDDTPECSDEVPCADGFTCVDGACVADTGCELDEDCPAGQSCEDGECIETPCTSADDCPECEVGNAPSCTDGVCGCGPACAEGCADGTACCFGTNSCVPVTATCAATECPRGTRLEAVSVSYDSVACAAEAECECVVLPPLDPGVLGRDLDLGISPDGKHRVAVAYNSTYGDLMFGVLDAEGAITWQYALGAPTTGTAVGDINGPRGGIAERGPDVGLDPSVEVTNAGVALVSYGSRVSDEVGLHFAVGTPGDSGYTWTTFPVELGPQLGRWSDLMIGADGNPVLVYAEMARRLEDGTWAGEVRVRTASTAIPSSVDDFGAAVLLDQVASAEPCGNSCSGRRVCRVDTQECVVPERASACDPGCDAETQACLEDADGNRACQDVTFPAAVVALPDGAGLFADADWLPSGELGVAHYDRFHGNLRWVVYDPIAGAVSAPAVIVDGEALDAGGVAVDTGDVGWFPDAFVADDGVVHITYFDASNSRLLEFNAGTGIVSVVDDGVRCIEFVDGTCVSSEISLVGYDSAMYSASGELRVVFQDSTRLDLMERALGGFGWGTYITLSGDADPYDGAYGFYTDILSYDGEQTIATMRFNIQAEPRVRDVVAIER